MAMLACQGQLLLRRAVQAVVGDACIQTMMHARDLIHGPMDVTSPPDFL
jgi:hypothetical protein